MNESPQSVTDNPDDLRKAYAALLYALGVTRGQLESVRIGAFEMVELRRICESTTLEHIAKSIGLTESMLDLDWDDYLTKEQKRAIQGHDK